MSELSVFIDESGDFGEYSIQPAYYLVTFVFHDQRQDITTNIQHLEESVSNSGFQLDYIHTGPVIRREEIFDSYTIDERRKLIYKMLNFVVASPISHLTVCIDRRQAQDRVTLSGRLARAINIAMLEHIDYFNSFDRILVYYDNGQNELSSILNAVFSVLFSNVEFRKAEPQRYRLLQAADFICTVELLKIKQAEHRLSKSEEKFFYKPQELKKTFFKSVAKKAYLEDRGVTLRRTPRGSGCVRSSFSFHSSYTPCTSVVISNTPSGSLTHRLVPLLISSYRSFSTKSSV